jgi:hypothetical protein
VVEGQEFCIPYHITETKHFTATRLILILDEKYTARNKTLLFIYGHGETQPLNQNSNKQQITEK